MGHYLIQLAYTSEAWGKMVKNPQDRAELVRPVVESLGGKLTDCYLSFGEYDIVALCEFPDDTVAAAFSLAVSAGGSAKAFKTTPLMTMAEGVEAMKKAGGAGYKPPG